MPVLSAKDYGEKLPLAIYREIIARFALSSEKLAKKDSTDAHAMKRVLRIYQYMIRTKVREVEPEPHIWVLAYYLAKHQYESGDLNEQNYKFGEKLLLSYLYPQYPHGSYDVLKSEINTSQKMDATLKAIVRESLIHHSPEEIDKHYSKLNVGWIALYLESSEDMLPIPDNLMEDEIESRADDIDKIYQKIESISAIFKEFLKIVGEQGASVEAIKSNINRAYNQTREGSASLSDAKIIQQKGAFSFIWASFWSTEDSRSLSNSKSNAFDGSPKSQIVTFNS